MVKWSYSSLNLFQQCPKKYYHLRVAKDAYDPPSPQIRYGLEVHKAAEDYVRDGTPLPPSLSYMQASLDKLREMPGEIMCEQRLGLTKDLEPCKFGAPQAWWRGIADLLVVDGDTAKVLDYKTGKSQYADTKQLELLSLAVFKHYPQVQRIKAALLFVVHSALVKAEYAREESETRWTKWLEETARLEAAYKNNVWNPQQNFTCRAWCPVLNCKHNGREP
jgi:hypothetical protein